MFKQIWSLLAEVAARLLAALLLPLNWRALDVLRSVGEAAGWPALVNRAGWLVCCQLHLADQVLAGKGGQA